MFNWNEWLSFQLVLRYVSGFDPVELRWTPTSSSGGHLSGSYIICQLEWYSVKITKLGSSLTLVVNGVNQVHATVPDTQGMVGAVHLGNSASGKCTVCDIKSALNGSWVLLW